MHGCQRREEAQLVFDVGPPVPPGRRSAALARDVGHGEVFTRRWVVELILDLSGYTADRDLAKMTAVEPACGVGAFLVPMVERLVDSCARHARPLTDARSAIRAFDLLPANAELAQKAAMVALADAGCPSALAEELAQGWVTCDDFLLSDARPADADFVLGNPPYIRLEDVPSDRQRAYRTACPTMRGRSDVFIGFLEKGLVSLGSGGVLGVIVADRWMHNQYGAALRAMIAEHYSVEVVVSMHDVDAFEERVSAYPAVVVIRRRPQRRAVAAHASGGFDRDDAQDLTRWARSRSRRLRSATVRASRLPGWFGTRASWPSGSPENLAVVAELETRFPPVESAAPGTRVGIGVASGLDDVFLVDDAALVEHDRLLPLLTTNDTVRGTADWSGTYLVDPWREGRLVDLAAYPRLRRYLKQHEARLRARHVARSNPNAWYRTIDRVDPELRRREKLVIPELKSTLHPVLDRGATYPHHGLYFITSERYDLEVLGGLLLSDVAEMFVATYCVKMRGGSYRFQAQYLRRIRVPLADSIARRDRNTLARAFAERDRELASAVARRVYGLSPWWRPVAAV